MTKNVGPVDRVLRVVLALVLGVTAVVTGSGSVLGVVLLVVAAVLVATAATGFCPLYRLLGLSTVPAHR